MFFNVVSAASPGDYSGAIDSAQAESSEFLCTSSMISFSLSAFPDSVYVHLTVPVVCLSNNAFVSMGSVPYAMNAGEYPIVSATLVFTASFGSGHFSSHILSTALPLFLTVLLDLSLGLYGTVSWCRTPSFCRNLLNTLLINCISLSVIIALGTPYLVINLHTWWPMVPLETG